ncbi:hypothetical protein GW17_00010178 [Ensete ventricosum]|nr:hypothetical protein GW17_00010178 [Ensete ventricosum]
MSWTEANKSQTHGLRHRKRNRGRGRRLRRRCGSGGHRAYRRTATPRKRRGTPCWHSSSWSPSLPSAAPQRGARPLPAPGTSASCARCCYSANTASSSPPRPVHGRLLLHRSPEPPFPVHASTSRRPLQSLRGGSCVPAGATGQLGFKSTAPVAPTRAVANSENAPCGGGTERGLPIASHVISTVPSRTAPPDCFDEI